MTEIPADVIEAAEEAYKRYGQTAYNSVDLVNSIARAIMAERERCNVAPTPHLQADHVEELRLAAKAIRAYMPETLPANADGQIHFARALAEAAADAIEEAVAALP